MFSKPIFLVHQNAALCCIVLEVQNLSKAFVEISNHGVTDFYTSYNAEKEPFWKHSGKKEKVIVTIDFSFAHKVFCPIKENLHHLNHFEIFFWKCSQFGQELNCRLLNLLPNKKFLEWSKLKAFADDKKKKNLYFQNRNSFWDG